MPEPDGFDAASARLLHARHLAAYDWAIPYVVDNDVLEIGVHRGYGSKILAPETARFTGVDLLYDHVLQTRRDAGVNVVQANGQKLPFPDGSFDVVLTFQVIEHVWDVHAYLKEISRVLRPGGMLLVSTPQAKSRLYPGQMPWNEEHLREYDEYAWPHVLGAVFDQVACFGLFAQHTADRIERRRVWQDPWQHYWGGPWAGPLRRLGRLLSRVGSGPAISPADLAALSSQEDETLLASFYVDIDHLDAAHDLLAVCRKAEAKAESTDDFDAIDYWKKRISHQPTLQGTGTSAAPLAWQQWLYRGKERAYRRLLKRQHVSLVGKSVLDFGCGTGYFEDVWERSGSRQVAGIDVVPEVVEDLARRFPHRRYVCGDVADEDIDLSPFGTPDLVTAIDVLYHIVDDEKLVATLAVLLELLPPDGYFLWTDALIENDRSASHVRFRSLNQWRQIMSLLGMQVVACEPVFALNNNPGRWSYRFPAFSGAVQHFLDLPVLRTMPRLANNWVILARRARSG